MSDIESILDKVRSRVYYRFRTHSEVDDLIQEAQIHAWKRWQENPEWDDARIIHHAVMKALSLVSDKSGEVPTGKPENRAALRKQANGEASRVKMTAYIRDYVKLHGKEPSNSQIARDLGMSTTNVRFHRNRLHLFDGAVDKATAKVYSLNAGLDASAAGEDTPAWVYRIPPAIVDYDAVATKVDLQEAISTLNDRDRYYLYLEFWEDKPYVEIAKALGCGGAYVNKLRKQILSKLKTELVA